jgi:hypothetical protein
MSIIVKSAKPRDLISSIKRHIDSKGTVLWTYDSDGDFSYQGEYHGRAWLRPHIAEDQIRFVVLTSKGTTMARLTYAIYHAKWVELLLSNFDEDFSSATISALPGQGDIIKLVVDAN